MDKLKRLEKRFLRTISQEGYDLEKILMSNARKKQITALVADRTGKNYIAKWAENDSPNGTSNLFKEIEFYNTKHSCKHCVDVVSSGANLLVLSYFESVTLREWLLGYSRETTPDECVKKVVDAYFELFFLHDEKRFAYTKTSEALLLKMYGNLLTSGPMNTSSGRFERLQNRFRLWYTRPLLENTVSKFRKENRKMDFIAHCDLHLNNLLIDPSTLKIKVIDWENYCQESLLPDLLYSAAMFRGLLEQSTKLATYFEAQLQRLISFLDTHTQSVFLLYYRIFCIAISANRRFQNGNRKDSTEKKSHSFRKEFMDALRTGKRR